MATELSDIEVEMKECQFIKNFDRIEGGTGEEKDDSEDDDDFEEEEEDEEGN